MIYLLNSLKARAVGSVCGVYSDHRVPSTRLRERLLTIDFEARLVPHAKRLKKIEIRQLNSVLNQFSRAEWPNG